EGAAGFPANRQQLRPGAFRTSPEKGEPGLRRAISTFPERAAQQSVSLVAGTSQIADPVSDSPQKPGSENLTFLVLKDGGGRIVTDYWFESGQRIRFVSVDGTLGVLPIGTLDLGRTVKLNRERGVEFVVQARDAGN